MSTAERLARMGHGSRTMIAYKAGVRVVRRTMALEAIENGLLATRAALGYPAVVLVTSIHDSRHSTTSAHYRDAAEDVRTKGPASNAMGSTARKRRFASTLRAMLGPRFTVILERLGTPSEHIHVQVKKGKVYP